MKYEPSYIYNTATQAVETNHSIWVQIADALRTIGDFFIAVGQVLVRIGEIIYCAIFR